MLKPLGSLAIALLSLALAFGQEVPEDPGLYAEFQTTGGTFIAELHFEKAPITCAHFVSLAEGQVILWNGTTGSPVAKPFYDGLPFHRLIDGFVIQGGDLGGYLDQSDEYWFPDEARPDLTHDQAGVLSMANRGPNSNGSQFFFTFSAQEHLDGLHTVFGQVVVGLEALEALSTAPTSGAPDHQPDPQILLETVTIHRVGELAEAFAPLPLVFPQRKAALTAPLREPGIGPVLRILAAPNTRYALNASFDLAAWEDVGFLSGKSNSEVVHDITFAGELTAENPAKFIRVAELLRYQSEDRSGSTLTISTPVGESGSYEESITLNSGLLGVYEAGGQSYPIRYRWFKIAPLRSQVEITFIESAASQPIIQYFLDWETDSSGSVYLRDATPDPATSGGVDDWVLEGTFTYQDPNE